MQAVERLRQLIFSGQLAAGSDHLETELADQLGMSRTPVREAVLVLAQQGLLDVRPRKGVRIASLSVRDMEEIYAVLTALESLAAEQAAAANHGQTELAGLLGAIEAMDTALAAGNREAWAIADDRFHTELARLSGNSRIQSIVGMMADQVRRARAVTLHIRLLPTQSNADHRAVYEAIRAGDSGAARDRHRQHREQAGRMLVELLRKHHLHHL